MKEIRYMLEVKDFNKIPSDYKENYKIDWYFDNYRIRQSVSVPKDPKLNGWFKIYNSEAGSSVKRKIKIKPPSKKLLEDMNKKAIFYTRSDGKFLDELYIENIKLYVNNKLIKEFYTTEAETKEDLKNIQKLKQNSFIKDIKKIGEVSMKEICLKFLKK